MTVESRLHFSCRLSTTHVAKPHEKKPYRFLSNMGTIIILSGSKLIFEIVNLCAAFHAVFKNVMERNRNINCSPSLLVPQVDE